MIGSGAFGTVHQGEWKVGETELEVGIKMVRDPSSGDHLSLLRQAAVMGQFSHPSIVNLYGVVSIGKPVSVVVYYCCYCCCCLSSSDAVLSC